MASGSAPAAPLLGERVRLDRLVANVDLAELAASRSERVEESTALDERDARLLFLEAGFEGAAEVWRVQDAVDVVKDIVVGQVVAQRGPEPGDCLRVEVGDATGGECIQQRRRSGCVLVAPAGEQ